MAFIASARSRRTPKRWSNRVPWFSISGTFHPAPRPTSTRPPDTTSRLATAFAVAIGSRWGSSMMPKPSRSAGPEGDRSPVLHRRRDGRDRVGHGGHDLVRAHDAQVKIRHERQRAAPGHTRAVEHDRPGLRDRGGAAGEDAVDRVEVARAE